ncbi:hypothetical protein [Paenibacillus sp. YYML68]|uniref:hypothetical protein n=1 Tax=Paenibacillus sp. YYML68 TaxID=2909250 RepID=UPI002493A697|nr:hypothetical protein [Paenibacillus sp. YYML68]
MKANLKRILSVGVIASTVLSIGVAYAGTQWIPFSKRLPIWQNWTELASDMNENNNNAEAAISNVGSNYKVNLNIYEGSTQVSNTYSNADDGTTAEFTVDSSAKEKAVTLRGWSSTFNNVTIDVSGKFRADKL